jgi:hypothetical protein
MTEALLAVAVILSALVRAITGGQRWDMVREGRARHEDMVELTSVHDRERLQALFGPTQMNGIFLVSEADVRARRPRLAMLTAEPRMDYACMAAGVFALVFVNLMPILPGAALMVAAAIQLTGWLASAGIVRS